MPEIRSATEADLPRLLDAAVPLRKLLHTMGSFRARYFLLDDPLADVDDYHRSLDDLEEGAEQEAQEPLPAEYEGLRIGRNDPCPCGSGKKYKQCHGKLA